MNHIKVSIVLPVYNGEKYLRQSIESILQQTCENLELIIVNDCSTDTSLNIAQEYAEKDTRIRILNNEHNLKLPSSLNAGFKMAHGKYLTWTSDDNVYKEKAIEILSGHLDSNPDVGFVYSNYACINEEGKVIEECFLPDPNMLPLGNTVGACFMYRKEIVDIVGEYNKDYFLIEDYEYWLRCYLNCKMEHINDNLYYYRIHGKSLSSTRLQEINDMEIVLFKKYYLFFIINIKNKKILFKYYDRLLLHKDKIKGISMLLFLKQHPTYMIYILNKKVTEYIRMNVKKIRRK
ncbi:MAG TPA: glycosyltransferase [Sedimentibacter sp.]|nr:glycosyltransferase [Sedimentibacter sp.]